MSETTDAYPPLWFLLVRNGRKQLMWASTSIEQEFATRDLEYSRGLNFAQCLPMLNSGYKGRSANK